jgi:hypothetical protein
MILTEKGREKNPSFLSEDEFPAYFSSKGTA